MDLKTEAFDDRIRARARTEPCPLPEGFDERLEGQLAKLPQGSGGRWPRRRLVMVVAAALLLTACTAGAATVILRQARYEYFDNMEDAARAATEAALAEGADTAAAGVRDSEVQDFPELEPIDLEELMSSYDRLLEHRTGGPEDGWTGMFTGEGELMRVTLYQADALSGSEGFWPVDPPDLAWLEENYVPLPGGQSWGSTEGIGAGAGRKIYTETFCSGEYHSAAGAPFRLNWSFHPLYEEPDSYTVTENRVEEYTTADGATVTIEWGTSVNGQSRFWAMFGYGYAGFDLNGAELEPEEVYAILDHMNLSALTTYDPHR